ncbi:MAG: hypothetical protein IID38_07210 [Planctomycetes bacterium]|nr:hypothetical protein [Planctomycetota bacterium]
MARRDDGGAATPPDAARGVPRRESLTRKGVRLSGYLAWVVLAQVFTIGLPRLCIFPLCAHFIGDVEFGNFVFALGLVNLIGLAPMKGLTKAVFREYAAQKEPLREVLIRTAFYMGAGLLIALMTVATAACAGIRIAGGADYEIFTWVALLVPGVVAQNLVWLGVMDLSIARRFRERAFWWGMTGLMVGLALPGIFYFGKFGSAGGYSLGFIVVLVVLLVARRRLFLMRPRFDRNLARHLAPIWVVFFFESFVSLSSRYVHRSILGAFWPPADVSRLFVASSIVTLFNSPLNMVSLLVTTLLARHATLETIPVRLRVAYASAALIGAAGVYVMLRLVGAIVLPLLYPSLAEDALVALRIMAPGAAIAVLNFAARPFVIKFSPWRSIPLLSAVTLAGHLLPGILLIPSRGLSGAAWSYCIGSAFMGLLWFGVFVGTLMRKPSSTAREDTTFDEMSSDAGSTD